MGYLYLNVSLQFKRTYHIQFDMIYALYYEFFLGIFYSGKFFLNYVLSFNSVLFKCMVNYLSPMVISYFHWTWLSDK